MPTRDRSPGFRQRSFVCVTSLLLSLVGCLAPNPQNVSVWCTTGDDVVTRTSPPALETDAFSSARRTLRIAAAARETAALQVALHADTPPIGPLTVTLDAFTNPADAAPATLPVQTYRVQDVRCTDLPSWYPQEVGTAQAALLVPDVLVPWNAPRGGGPVVLSSTRNELVWLDVTVPPGTPPGQYRSRLHVRGGLANAEVFACEVLLDVLPLELPAEPPLPVIARVDPTELLAAQLGWSNTAPEQLNLDPAEPTQARAIALLQQTMNLLHTHNLNPVLWAAFPKYTLGGESVTITWDNYDALVAGWLDGTAFADNVPVAHWPLPASLDYPPAASAGGYDAPQYARLLGAYWSACNAHFAERGWGERAFARPVPPAALNAGAYARAARVAAIAQQQDLAAPLVLHIPPRSLRGLGWYDAPTKAVAGADIWAVPGLAFEPEAIAAQKALGQRAWLLPDAPPYSPALALAAPATDPWLLPWVAYRYGLDGVWIEDAASLPTRATRSPLETAWQGPGLIYAGKDYGVSDAALPSLRLKRLQRGLYDVAYLKLLEANGQRLLAQQIAAQLVRRAGTDACLENLLSTASDGWASDPRELRLARRLMATELTHSLAAADTSTQPAGARPSDWYLLFSQAQRVEARVVGVRLAEVEQRLQALVFTSVDNASNRALAGQWVLSGSTDWQLDTNETLDVGAGGRRSGRLTMALPALTYNTDGVYPIDLAFRTTDFGEFAAPARLAVAACPYVATAPRIDGRLDDWALASNNVAADFRLARSPRDSTGRPTLPTQAFFRMDAAHLYVGIRAALQPGQPPLWKPDNIVPVDGAIPWGQDCLEILLDPRPTAEGAPSDLYCLQIKPSGVLISTHGCRTEPPMGAVEPWISGAQVAVNIERDAWVAEVAVPLAALGPAARQVNLWGVNVTRLDSRRGEYSSWSGARPHAYLPRALGNLIMVWP